ncbi:hypothetical protein LP52_01275 [Streptomonospora alba]|uniref:Uncharacterized protein n=1 Tax=Streptomonospora alba TaxID=183763 RepID=A0A0C2JGQ8_9ACTN|nr:hypothetical protein [Streptomonospora alba]KII00482.1 hypothetical protein LP52_01275 [Streptomonospora alba]
MTEQAAQLVLHYLSRVADAAYGAVPARRRAAYLADVRSRVERACATGGAETPEDVRRILRGFGRPADLVAHELAAEINDRSDGVDPDPDVAPLASGDTEDGTAQGAAEERERVVSTPDNRPVREPPPWRSGSNGGARTRSRPAAGAAGRSPRGDTLSALPAALRRHPGEALGVGLYLAAGAFGVLAGAWLIGAAVVALSRVWTGLDKAIGLGAPILATLVGMALWESGVEHIHVDQIIWESLTDTGVVGLRLAGLGTGLFLALRLTRL